MREVLLAYLELLREQARADYATAMQVWASRTAFGGNAKPPKIPEILQHL
jgi:hypothetical protein